MKVTQIPTLSEVFSGSGTIDVYSEPKLNYWSLKSEGQYNTLRGIKGNIKMGLEITNVYFPSNLEILPFTSWYVYMPWGEGKVSQ